MFRFEKKKAGATSYIKCRLDQELNKPTEESLYVQREILGELVNYADTHPLNTVSITANDLSEKSFERIQQE
jgi:hypothetical protein